jgi:hypothetical protein
MRPLDQEVRMGVFSLHFSTDRAFHPEAFPSGGAGMLSTAADALRLLEAIRNDGAPVAAPDVLREMKKPFGEHGDRECVLDRGPHKKKARGFTPPKARTINSLSVLFFIINQ